MSHQNHAQQEQAEREWERALHWNATTHGWIAKTDDLFIFVPEKVYERATQAYFTSFGIKRKTYSEIMRPAEEAWERQCDLERTFQANLEPWLSEPQGGVQVMPRKQVRRE